MKVEVAAKKVRETYGKVWGKNCGQCCNRQPRKYGSAECFCLAYGKEFPESWPANEQGCSLWNIPFMSLRPRHRPLYSNDIISHNSQPNEQYSMLI